LSLEKWPFKIRNALNSREISLQWVISEIEKVLFIFEIKYPTIQLRQNFNICISNRVYVIPQEIINNIKSILDDSQGYERWVARAVDELVMLRTSNSYIHALWAVQAACSASAAYHSDDYKNKLNDAKEALLVILNYNK